MIAPCMAQGLLEPPYSLFVKLATDDAILQNSETDVVEVSVSAVRLSKDPVTCSLTMSCSAFEEGDNRISVDDVSLLREASQAAKAGIPFRKESAGSTRSVFESATKENRWVVTMTRGKYEATFFPEEPDRLDRVMAEGHAAERWYQALLSKEGKPEETAESHPPVSQGMLFMEPAGKVAGKAVTFGGMLRIFPDSGNNWITWSVSGDGQSVRGDWAAEIPDRISEALAAVRTGKPYLFENEFFSVMGNRETKEAEIALDKEIRGSFDEANLAEIEKLQAAGDARMLWFQQNEGLFFKAMRKAK